MVLALVVSYLRAAAVVRSVGMRNKEEREARQKARPGSAVRSKATLIAVERAEAIVGIDLACFGLNIHAWIDVPTPHLHEGQRLSISSPRLVVPTLPRHACSQDLRSPGDSRTSRSEWINRLAHPQSTVRVSPAGWWGLEAGESQDPYSPHISSSSMKTGALSLTCQI